MKQYPKEDVICPICKEKIWIDGWTYDSGRIICVNCKKELNKLLKDFPLISRVY